MLKSKFITRLCVAQLALGLMVATLPVHSVFAEDNPTAYTAGFKAKVQQTLSLVNNASGNVKVKEAINSFTSLLQGASAEDMTYALNSGDMDNMYAKLCKQSKDDKELAEYFMAKLTYQTYATKAGLYGGYVDQFFEDATNKDAYENISISYSSYRAYTNSVQADGTTLIQLQFSESKTTVKNEPQAPDITPGEDEVITDNEAGQKVDESKMEKQTWKEVSYKDIDGKSYRFIETKTFDDNGNIIVVNTEKFLEENRVGTMEDWLAVNNTTGAITWDSVANELSNESEAKRSTLTLQYTLNKNEKEPDYHDTGIFVTEKGATYQQVRGVLYQISYKLKTKYMEDSDKFLIVIDKKPVVSYQKKDVYTKADLAAIFKDFDKVGVTIKNTKIGQTVSLSKQLKDGTDQYVNINGVKSKLRTTPIEKDAKAILPLREFAELLNLEIKEEADVLTVSNGGVSMVFTGQSDKAKVNGVDTQLNHAVIRNESVLMGDVEAMLTAFGYKMVWDTDDSLITISTK